jgi:hypothetical protein
MELKSKDQTPLTLNTQVFHDPEIVSAPIEEELVMFSLERGRYYGLDDIASHIWQKMAEPISIADLCEGLLDEYDIDRETCQRETLALLNWLYEQELVKINA